MIKSIILTAAILASTHALAISEDTKEKIHKLCIMEARFAERAAILRHKTNDMEHEAVADILRKAPVIRPMLLAVFRTKRVESSFFNNDQEDAIKSFKNAWYNICVMDWAKEMKGTK
jgi:hypothetical protein